MRIILSTLFICAFLLQSCNEEPTSHSIFSEENIESTFFKINNGRDTILKGDKGVQISIPKNSFLNQKDNPVLGEIDIELKEALTIADMIIGGLETRSENGDFLESSGMIYFNASQNHSDLKLAPDSKISVVYPNTGIKGNSKVFYRSEQGAWSESHELINSEIVKEIALGESLFRKNCSMCHNDNLREALTGPALGNVHLFREKEWLKDHTRNSQKMINEGDSLSVCIWQQWKPAIMISFESLSDSEIEAIYLWIENESIIQGIDSSEVEFLTSCEFVPNRIGSVTFGNLDGTYNESSETDTFLVDNINYIFSKNESHKTIVSSIFRLNQLGWTNIDKFPDDSRTESRPFFVEIENDSFEIQVSIVFEYINMFLMGYKRPDGRFSFTNGENEKLTPFPIGEKAILIASGTNESNESFYAEKEITIGEKTIETLRLEPKSIDDILKRINERFN